VVADQLAAAAGEDGERLVKHVRYYWLLLADSHLTRRLFASRVRRIELLPCQRDRPAADRADFNDERAADGKVSRESVEREAGSCLVMLRSGKTGRFVGAGGSER
jgi:hypothetical protein